MKAIYPIIISSIFLLFFPLYTIGQDKNIDKIEMLYDQGNYKRVYRLSNKLQQEASYQKNAPLKLFEALSEYQLSKTKQKYTSKKAITSFKTYRSWDTIHEYDITYGIYIYDLQIGLVNTIRKLEKEGKSKEAKLKFDEYSYLFQHQASYDEITATKPEITTTAPEIEVEENASEEVKEISINKQQKNILKEAKKHIGTKYKFGGITPKGFDCSGFTQYVMAKNNIEIPRTSREQAVSYEKVKRKEAQIGDLVFFGSSKSKINHVGIISQVEKEKLYMIHASTSRGIMVTEITTNVYWSKKMLFITRAIED
jgi:cell wall-associated NlpC family hydrolase